MAEVVPQIWVEAVAAEVVVVDRMHLPWELQLVLVWEGLLLGWLLVLRLVELKE